MSQNALLDLKNMYSSDEENDFNDNEFSSHKPDIDSCKASEKFPLLSVPDSIRAFQGHIIEDTNEYDSPELHCGKIRSFPHERGNWASCLYIPVQLSPQLNLLCDKFSSITQPIANFYRCSHFHISLSKTVVLQHHWIQPFVDDIQRNYKHHKRFIVNFEDVEVYVNEEKTCTFIGLTVGLGHDLLLSLVKSVDEVLKEFNLSVYYENPSFHSSILWCLNNQKQSIEKLLPDFQDIFNAAKLENSQTWNINVEEIHCKIGNRLFKIKLS